MTQPEPIAELSGITAYQLFTSSDYFPLHTFLTEWRQGVIECHPSYVISVINAYQRMCDNSGDGRYQGIVRRRMS